MRHLLLCGLLAACAGSEPGGTSRSEVTAASGTLVQAWGAVSLDPDAGAWCRGPLTLNGTWDCSAHSLADGGPDPSPQGATHLSGYSTLGTYGSGFSLHLYNDGGLNLMVLGDYLPDGGMSGELHNQGMDGIPWVAGR